MSNSVSVNEFLEIVLTKVREMFPGLQSCEVYPGQFTADELTRASAKTPAIRIAAFDLGRIECDPSGQVDANFGISLVIITRDKRDELPREKAAVNIMQPLIQLLGKGTSFNCANAFPSTDVQATNLFGATLSKMKVQLWEIRWSQTLRLDDPIWTDNGIIPLELYASQAPEIGAEHEDDYQQIHAEAPFELP